MNLALLLPHKLFLGLRRAVQLLQGDAPQPLRPHAMPRRPAQSPLCQPSRAAAVPLGRIGSGAANMACSSANSAANSPARTAHRPSPATAPATCARVMPLRVLRVVEKDQPVCSTGRLVISGRMADVCAELDRLAARELALQ